MNENYKYLYLFLSLKLYQLVSPVQKQKVIICYDLVGWQFQNFVTVYPTNGWTKYLCHVQDEKSNSRIGTYFYHAVLNTMIPNIKHIIVKETQIDPGSGESFIWNLFSEHWKKYTHTVQKDSPYAVQCITDCYYNH